VVMQMVLTSFQSEKLNGDLTALTVGAFEPVLEGIPDEDIWTCYLYAQRFRALRASFTVADLWWAWEQIQERRKTEPDFYADTPAHQLRRHQRAAEEERERVMRENCQRCYSTGMEIVPGKGARRCDHVGGSNLVVIGKEGRGDERHAS
jgi:hypothetical protein